MAVTLNINFPTCQPLRFTNENLPDNQRANFDQIRYSQAKYAAMDKNQVFYQKFENADSLQVQFLSNFPNNKVGVYSCVDNELNLLVENIPSILKQYRGLEYFSDCSLNSLNGFLFLFFDEGYTYTDNTYTTEVDAILNQGRLPNINVRVGDVVYFKYDSSATVYTATVTAISWNVALQAEGLLLNIVSALSSTVTGKVTIVYNEKDQDLYYQNIDLSGLDEETHFIRVSTGIGEDEAEDPIYQNNYLSEPLDVSTLFSDSGAIDYSHTGIFGRTDQFGFLYEDGYKSRIRLDSQFFQFEPSGEIEIDTNDTGRKQLLRAVPYRSIKLVGMDIPSWLCDKLNKVFAHDTIIINGYEYRNENFGSFDFIPSLDLGSFEVTLIQVNDPLLFENEVELNFEASFSPDSITDDGTGGMYEVVFNSTFGGSFTWQNLPSWITSNVSTFSDGDTIELTIDESTFPERSVNLSAITSGLDLSAIVAIVQEEGVLGSDIVSVTPDEIVALLGVSVNHDVDVVVSSPSINWQATSNQIWVRVSSPVFSGNQTITVRTVNPTIFSPLAIVTITNIDNPLDFKQITVVPVS